MIRVFKNKRIVKAVTLLELIMSMVIIGLVVATMVGILGAVTRQAGASESVAMAAFIAQSKMEGALLSSFNPVNSNQSGNLAFGGVKYLYDIVSGNGVCTGAYGPGGAVWPQYSNAVDAANGVDYECIEVIARRQDGVGGNVALTALKAQE